MYIIVGLGNPGSKYDKTRHNTGFIVLDMLADLLGININKIKHKATIGEGMLDSEKIILAKPQTYMNLSGESVIQIKNWYKVDNSRIIVIYDDIDLDIGTVRIRPSGSAGTHNGMRSIIYCLNAHDFPRIRIGIGKPPEGMDLADYVLTPFKDHEIPEMIEASKRAIRGVKLMVTQGISKAMNECNGG